MNMRGVMTLALTTVVACVAGPHLARADESPSMPVPPVVGGPSMLPSPSLHLDKKVKAGESVEIRLPSNPTTGYSWAIDPAASQALDKLGPASESFAMAPQTAPMTGVPGEQVFQFAATQAGQVRVLFVYRRPWAPLADITTAEANIAIE